MSAFLDRFVGNISPSALLVSTFFWSWFDLVPFSPLLPAAAGGSADPVVLAFSLLVGSSTLALFAGCARLRACSLNARFFALCSLAFGCCGALLIYAGSLWGIQLVSLAGGGLIGIYQGVGAVLVGSLAVCQGKTNALIHLAACLPINLVFVLLGLFLRPGAAVVLCAVLPLLSALSYKVFLERGRNAQVIGRVALEPRLPMERTAVHVPCGSVRERTGYIVLLLLVTVSFGFMNCRVVFFGATGSPGSYTDYSSLVIRAVVAVLVFSAYVFYSWQPYSLLKAAMVLMSSGFLILGLAVGADAPFRMVACSLFYAGYAAFDLLIWAIIVIMHHGSRMSLQRFLCIAYALDQLGNFIGTVLGLMEFGDASLTAAFVVAGAVLMACAFVALSERNVVRSGLGVAVIEVAETDSLEAQPTGPRELGEKFQQKEDPAPDSGKRPGDASRLEHRDGVGDLAARYFLTAREADVLELLLAGRSAPYIAERLTVSQNTVKTHVRHIYAKLDVHNRQELLDLLARTGE